MSVVGCLDYVSHEALVGWIANLTHPERLEPVICTSSNRSTITLYPFIPRQDVRDTLGITGRFGFAIPLILLEGMDIVSLSSIDGTGLSAGQAIALPANKGMLEPEEPRLIILHIQKTAGTSLRAALTRGAKPGEVLFLYSDGFIGISKRELEMFSWTQRRSLRLVMGHEYFGIADLLPGPSSYATFLRQPEARLRSQYFHHLAGGTEFNVGGKSVDLHAAISQGLVEEFDNLMVRMIAGDDCLSIPAGEISERDVERALDNIRTRFRFVGLVEHMADHCTAFCASLAITPAPLGFENICQINDVSVADCDIDWRRVMHFNRFDTMLYERVQTEQLCGRNLSNAAAHQNGEMG